MGNTPFTTLTQFTVPVPNVLGQLNKIVGLFRKNTINLTGITAEVYGNVSFIRLITPEKPEKVTSILTGNGYNPIQTQVVAITLSNKAGELEKLTQFLVDQDININGIYGTTPLSSEEVSIVLSLDTPSEKPINFSEVFGKFFGTVAVTA